MHRMILLTAVLIALTISTLQGQAGRLFVSARVLNLDDVPSQGNTVRAYSAQELLTLTLNVSNGTSQTLIVPVTELHREIPISLHQEEKIVPVEVSWASEMSYVGRPLLMSAGDQVSLASNEGLSATLNVRRVDGASFGVGRYRLRVGLRTGFAKAVPTPEIDGEAWLQ